MGMCNTPLGDFNEDLLHHLNSPILSFMSAYGFSQLVKSPTTPQGTIIDHVYYKNPPDNVTKDTYYSDHDTVYCSILPSTRLVQQHSPTAITSVYIAVILL